MRHGRECVVQEALRFDPRNVQRWQVAVSMRDGRAGARAVVTSELEFSIDELMRGAEPAANPESHTALAAQIVILADADQGAHHFTYLFIPNVYILLIYTQQNPLSAAAESAPATAAEPTACMVPPPRARGESACQINANSPAEPGEVSVVASRETRPRIECAPLR